MNTLRTWLWALLLPAIPASVAAQTATPLLLQAGTQRLSTRAVPYQGDPLLNIRVERTAPVPPLRPPGSGDRSAWHSAGIGALIGLGVGSAVGLVAANNSSEGLGAPGPGFIVAVYAGGGALLGGLVGLVAGSSSSEGGLPFPGH